MNAPAITILTATYNKPRHLREAAAAVFAQTRRDWLWWIVLDGATEETVMAAEEIAEDVRVVLYRHATTDAERAASYRPARIFDQYMPQTETAFLCWLSDDDLWEPFFLEFLLPPLETTDLHCVCGAGRVVVERDGKFKFIRDSFGMGSDTCVFRRSVYMELMPKLSQEKRRHVADQVLISAMAGVAPILQLPLIVMTHRVTDLSAHRDLFMAKEKKKKCKARLKS